MPDDAFVPPPEPENRLRVLPRVRSARLRESARRAAPLQQLPFGGLIGFAPAPGRGDEWSDEEAQRAYRLITRVITPGNPEQSRFLLKPLHPDGGGAYTHNGPRRCRVATTRSGRCWPGGFRGERTGSSCS